MEKGNLFLPIHNSSIHGGLPVHGDRWEGGRVGSDGGKGREAKGNGRNRAGGGSRRRRPVFQKSRRRRRRRRRRKDLSRSSRTIFFLPYKDLGNP
jgi:hypothetical protein